MIVRGYGVNFFTTARRDAICSGAVKCTRVWSNRRSRGLVTSSTRGSVVLCDVPEWQTDIEGINNEVFVVDATTAPEGFRGGFRVSPCVAWNRMEGSRRTFDRLRSVFSDARAGETSPHGLLFASRLKATTQHTHT